MQLVGFPASYVGSWVDSSSIPYSIPPIMLMAPSRARSQCAVKRHCGQGQHRISKATEKNQPGASLAMTAGGLPMRRPFGPA